MEQGPKDKAAYTVEEAQRACLTEEELRVGLLRGYIQPPASGDRLEMRNPATQVQAGPEVITIEEIERKAFKKVVPGAIRQMPKGPSS